MNRLVLSQAPRTFITFPMDGVERGGILGSNVTQDAAFTDP